MRDITPEVWRAWCGFALSSGTRNRVSAMLTLLLDVVGLPEPTVEAVRGRRPFTPHSDADERGFSDASWRVAESTITRIGGNAERVARYRAGEKTMDEGRVRIAGRVWGFDELADYLIRHGVLPGQLTSIAQRQLRGVLKVPGNYAWKAALFPIAGEIAALQFLYVLSGGYSPVSLRDMKVGAFGNRAPRGSRSTRGGGRRDSPGQTGCCGNAPGEARAAPSDRGVRRAASPRLAGCTRSPDRRTVCGVRTRGRPVHDGLVDSRAADGGLFVDQSHRDQGRRWRRPEPYEVTDRRAARRRDTGSWYAPRRTRGPWTTTSASWRTCHRNG